MEAVDDVLKELRATYTGAFWPKPAHLRKAAESVLARRGKTVPQAWERTVETGAKPTDEEKAQVSEIMAEFRRWRPAPIGERLAAYRKLVEEGFEGTMLEAAPLIDATIAGNPDTAEPLPEHANPQDKPRHVLPLDGPERDAALERIGR